MILTSDFDLHIKNDLTLTFNYIHDEDFCVLISEMGNIGNNRWDLEIYAKKGIFFEAPNISLLEAFRLSNEQLVDHLEL